MADHILWLYPLGVLLLAATIEVVALRRERKRQHDVIVVDRVKDLEHYRATVNGRSHRIVVDATMSDDEIAEMLPEATKSGRHERSSSTRSPDISSSQ